MHAYVLHFKFYVYVLRLRLRFTFTFYVYVLRLRLRSVPFIAKPDRPFSIAKHDRSLLLPNMICPFYCQNLVLLTTW